MADDQQRDGDASRAPRKKAHEGGRAGGPSRDGSRTPFVKREGERKPFVKRDGDRKPFERRDGERKPFVKRDGDRPYVKRDGERKPFEPRDGERKPFVKRDGDRPYAKRDGERKPFEPRDGERKPYARREGDRPYANRDGDRPYGKRDGDRKPFERRDGDRPYVKRDGDRKPFERRDGDRPYVKRDGDRKPFERRDGDRPFVKRDGDRKPWENRDGAGRGGPRPTRGGAGRPDRATRPEEIRSIRPRHDDPEVPDEVTPKDLHASARNELKTLSKENAEWVARHLAMAGSLIEDDPELAHQHALSASRRAGRIGIVRETLAITAYATGDYALALRELRTYRRISGNDDQIALMVDSERGVGRPDRALELGRSVDRSTLPVGTRVALAIAMSGARLDRGETERALQELDIPELDPDRAFEWSPSLFSARAAVLEELGRADEAARWEQRATVAEEAIRVASGVDDLETIEIDEIEEIEDEEPADVEPTADDAVPEELVDDASEDISIEDEVAEILADAGVNDEDDEDRA